MLILSGNTLTDAEIMFSQIRGRLWSRHIDIKLSITPPMFHPCPFALLSRKFLWISNPTLYQVLTSLLFLNLGAPFVYLFIDVPCSMLCEFQVYNIVIRRVCALDYTCHKSPGALFTFLDAHFLVAPCSFFTAIVSSLLSLRMSLVALFCFSSSPPLRVSISPKLLCSDYCSFGLYGSCALLSSHVWSPLVVCSQKLGAHRSSSMCAWGLAMWASWSHLAGMLSLENGNMSISEDLSPWVGQIPQRKLF